MSRLLTSMCLAAVLAVVLSGCVTTITGTAVRGLGGGPVPTDIPLLTESDLDQVLLSAGEVNGVMDATGMRVTASSEDMSDNSDAVSHLECLGAIYGAEKFVYGGSGWTAVRDEVLQEPVGDNDHWVEQIAVLYPSEQEARDFFETSKATWRRCGNSTIDIDNGDITSSWDIDTPAVGDTMLTQTSTQFRAGGWGCQHAMTTGSNLVVEAWACSDRIGDEGRSIVSEMLRNAARS